MKRIFFAAAVGTGVAGTLTIAGCASQTPTTHRPMVAHTATEAATSPGGDKTAGASAASRELDFFDALELRPLVAHDDLLEAALILGTGEGGKDSEERAAAAVRLGYVDAGYHHPPREAATVAEASRVLARVVRGGAEVSAEEAVAEMVGRGALPPTARPYQGLTGAQLVSMVGSTRDAMTQAGTERSPTVPPLIQPLTAAATPAEPEPAEPLAQTDIALPDTSLEAASAERQDLTRITITDPEPPAEADVAPAREPEALPPPRPVPPEPAPEAAPAAEPVPPPARQAPVTTRFGFKGRPEPLPDVALVDEKPRAASAVPETQPRVVQPVPEPDRTQAPRAQPSNPAPEPAPRTTPAPVVSPPPQPDAGTAPPPKPKGAGWVKPKPLRPSDDSKPAGGPQ